MVQPAQGRGPRQRVGEATTPGPQALEGGEFGDPLVESGAARAQLVVGYVEVGNFLLAEALPSAGVVARVQREIDLDTGAEIEHGVGEGGEGAGGQVEPAGAPGRAEDVVDLVGLGLLLPRSASRRSSSRPAALLLPLQAVGRGERRVELPPSWGRHRQRSYLRILDANSVK